MFLHVIPLEKSNEKIGQSFNGSSPADPLKL